jgi:hypothetical protein
MSYSGNKDIDRLVRQLVSEGWTYRRGAKHGQLRASAIRRPIIVPGTPGDHRCVLNFHADIRRALRGYMARTA